jgi:hypothetical protein
MRVRSPDLRRCARHGWCSPSVPADLRRAYVALPRSRFGRVAVGPSIGPGAGPTGAADAEKQPTGLSIGARVRWPMRRAELSGLHGTWAEWRGWRPIATNDASTYGRSAILVKLKSRSASVRLGTKTCGAWPRVCLVFAQRRGVSRGRERFESRTALSADDSSSIRPRTWASSSPCVWTFNITSTAA